MDIFVVGAKFILNGHVHETSYGDGRIGKRFTDYPVRIVRIIEGRRYPILLGDQYSNQLGWISEDELDMYATFVGISYR